MADRAKEGIIIEFEGETVKFDDSVNGVNKAIKLLQQNVRKLNSQMKIEGESPEKLKEIFEELNKQIQLTEHRIELAKKELDKFRDASGELIRPIDKNGQKQFDSLVSTINSSAVELTKLQDRANKVRHEFEQWDNIQLEKKLREASKGAKELGDNLVAVGRSLAPLSAVAAGALGGAFKAAQDFESAFVGVQKTVDETNFTTYEKLEQTIRRMSTELPSSATEIAKVMEIAGQLGIKADDIEKFTKTIIDLSNATNIMGDEGATALAQYYNIMQGDLSTVDRFGAALTELGNNSATTEAEILNMSKALAAAGSQIGLRDQEVLGLATTLASVGLSAERAGSSISTILRKVDQAVGENADSVQEWAKICGVSVEEFTNMWNTDVMKAIDLMITGLGTLDEETANFYTVLSDVNISNIRQIDTITRLANAHGKLSEYVAMSNKAWDANVALTNEANRRYGTTESQLKMLLNTVTDIGIELGQSFLPTINNLVSSMRPYLSSLKDFVSENQSATTATLGLTAALSPGLIVFGKGARTFSNISKTVADFSTSLRASGKSASEVASIIGKLTNGIGLAGGVGLVAAFTAFAIAVQNANDQTLQFKKTYQELSNTFEEGMNYSNNQFNSYLANLQYVDEYIQKIENLQTALENERLTEEQSAITKSQIADYVETLNGILGENVYSFDESTGALSRNGEKVKDLSSDYANLFEELKKSAWLQAHQDQLSQAIENEQAGYDMMSTAAQTYQTALSGIDYSNLNIPPEAIQSLQDFANQKISLEELNTQMKDLGINYQEYGTQAQTIAQAQSAFNQQAETANTLISQSKEFQDQYNSVLENGVTALTNDTTAINANITAMQTRRAELELQKQQFEQMGNADAAANIQAQIDALDQQIIKQQEFQNQRMLDETTYTDTSITENQRKNEAIDGQDQTTTEAMQTRHATMWTQFYNDATTQANGAFNAIDARQLAEKTLTVNVEYNDALGFVTGTGGFPMGFSTGGSGGFAGAVGAGRNAYMSGGFGDITINNSFSVSGTPSNAQLRAWGRTIANQVNEELGKKVRR